MKRSFALLLPAAAVLLAACTTMTDVTAYDDGVRLYREGSYASAKDAFETAVRLEPNNAAAINNRGVTKARLGDLDGAVMDYTRALRQTPGDAEIVFNRANAYAAAGNLPAAVTDFTTAVTLKPDYAQAFFNRGTVRAALGDSQGALADWRFAIALDRDPWTKAAMARAVGMDYPSAAPSALVREGSGAVAVIPPTQPGPSGVVTVAPPSAGTLPAPDVRALVTRAMARELEGDRAGAIADLRAALVAEPDAARRDRVERLLQTLEAAQ
jgi:tetratricopeptide (TPR) repeat protein